MLLLVRAHPDDLARGLRQAAEPGGDRLGCAGEAGGGLLVDLVAGREVERRVVAQGGDGVREGPRAQCSSRQLAELRVDPGDLLEADPVELAGVEVERRVDADEPAVGVEPALDVAHPGPLRGARRREDLGHEGVVEAGEGGPDLVVDGGPQGGREPLALGGGPAGRSVQPPERCQERPILGGLAEDLRQDRRRAVCRRAAGDAAVGQAVPERGHVLIRVGGHRTPAGHHVVAVRGRLQPLVVGDVEEVDRHALDRVDVPGQQPRIELGDVGPDRSPERVKRDPGCGVELERACQPVRSVQHPRVQRLRVRRVRRLRVQRLRVRRVRHERVRLVEQRREPCPGARDASVAWVREPVVVARVADGRGEQRVCLEVRLPVGCSEGVQPGPWGGGVQGVNHRGQCYRPGRPRTVRGASPGDTCGVTGGRLRRPSSPSGRSPVRSWRRPSSA